MSKRLAWVSIKSDGRSAEIGRARHLFSRQADRAQVLRIIALFPELFRDKSEKCFDKAAAGLHNKEHRP
jgi:hypothetical protein